MEPLTYVAFPLDIQKTEKNDDGTVTVWGPCTTDTIDHDDQIVDPEFARKGLSEWFETGANIRRMHQPDAVGVGVELVSKGSQHWLRSRIVDSNACKLVDAGVLRAYSVGIAKARIDRTRNPEARGGTIVDGKFVEVSLVDRPANADCKFELVKVAKDGSAVLTKTVVPANTEEEEDRGEELDEPRMDDADIDKLCDLAESSKLWEPEAVVYKKDYSTAKRKQLAKEGKALPDGSYPIADTEDLHNAYVLAASGHGNVKAAKRLIARRARELGVPNPFSKKKKVNKGTPPKADRDVTSALERAEDDIDDAQEAQDEDNEGWESGRTQEAVRDGDHDKVEVPYVLKRLHDYLCPAFDPAQVPEVYPTCSTVQDAIDVAYWQKAVATALEEGKPGAVAELSAVYAAAAWLAGMDPAAVADAAAVAHKEFKALHPDVTIRAGGDITAGMFTRPFITTNRAEMSPHGHPRIPSNPDVPEASDFRRPYLTDHEARQSPAAEPPHTATKAQRRFYTNNARMEAHAAAQDVHDCITRAHPEVCPMSAEVAPPATQAPANMPNGANSTPTPQAPPASVLKSDNLAEVVQAEVAKALKAERQKQAKKLAKSEKKIQKAKLKIRELEVQADPAAQAYRTGKVMGPFTQPEGAETVDGTAAEKAAVAERNEQIDWLAKQVRHADPTVSGNAMDRLTALCDPDELAVVLTQKVR